MNPESLEGFVDADQAAKSGHPLGNAARRVSYRKHGKQPRLGSMIVEDYVRPAAIVAGALEQRDGKCYYEGEFVIRFGFHNLRHGLATWLAGQGTDPMVIQRMLRHSSKDMTMHYIHPKARDAQEQYIAELGIVPGGSAEREL